MQKYFHFRPRLMSLGLFLMNIYVQMKLLSSFIFNEPKKILQQGQISPIFNYAGNYPQMSPSLHSQTFFISQIPTIAIQLILSSAETFMQPKGANHQKMYKNKLNFTKQIYIQEPLQLGIPERRINTAKARAKPSQLSQYKTLSTKPINTTRRAFDQSPSQLEHFASEEKHLLDNPPIFAQFQKLKLEDFVKMVITQKNNDELKTKEIIKSFNGTWFKTTQSPTKSSHKFYTRIGIKRTKEQPKILSNENSRELDHSIETFKKQYTPPNAFPLRKVNHKINAHSKYLIDVQKTDDTQHHQQNSPLKVNILRKPSKNVRAQKRPTAQFTHKPLKGFNQLGDSGLLKGKKLEIGK